MAENYSRPSSGFSFSFGGMNTKTPPDKLQENKYAMAQNIRAYDDKSIRSRPGLAQIATSATGNPVQALRAYATLETDNKPRFLFKSDVTSSSSSVFLDTGAAVDTGYAPGLGASFIPYRPNQSPQSFMYIGDAQQYRKLSAPSSTNAVIAQNVGIAEVQTPVDYGIGDSFFTPLATTANQTISYAHGGTAGVNTNTTKVADTVVEVFQDPALPPGTLAEYTVQTASATQTYQTSEFISIGTPNVDVYQIKDVYPALVGSVQIAGIYYYAGTTGRCVVVPFNIGATDNEGLSIMQQNLLTGVRRGSLVTLGGETCYVLGTAIAPDGTISFEIVTTTTHAAGEVLTGQPAIKVLLSSTYFGSVPTAPTVGAPISAFYASFTVGTGIGTQTSVVGISNPFSFQNVSYRPGDYLHISVLCNNLAFLNECKVLLDVSDGSFTKDYYFYSFRPSDIQAGVQNTLTQLGTAQLAAQRQTIDEEASAQGASPSSLPLIPGSGIFSDILIPLSELTRVGSDQTKTLLNLVKFQILVNANTGLTFGFHTIDLCGGFSPDVGDSGASYQYVIRPRSSLTGARGNPSPVARYGIRPRREEVQVILPTTFADPQVDYWDIFRIGGSLTTYTLVGSVPLGTANFLDNYADSDIVSSETLDYEDFQPWPTIDDPLNTTASEVTGTTAVVNISDTDLQANVLRYLPGNLVQLGQQVYTLWTRPTQIGSSDNFLFQFVENAGVLTTENVTIYEPAMAAQVLPYLWGPTESGGNIFGAGDPLRPGFVYFTKNFSPDSAPDSYNIELCPPSEPILGGEVLNGNSYAASTSRWWQLRTSFGGENQYTPVEAPVGRGLAAPYGHCTDGSKIYFVAKDGIYATAGGPGVSLTDDDLYNLFPHEGVPGQTVVYNGIGNFAPDYGRVNTFRLAYCNSYLYFDYQDSSGTPRSMVYDFRHQAWSKDAFFTNELGASIHYGIEQQEGSLNGTDTDYGLLVIGGSTGVLYEEDDNTDDAGQPFQCILATREFTAGDERAQKLFGDVFLDFLNPAASGSTNLTASSMSLGVPFGSTALTQNNTRQQVPIDLAGGTYAFALGLFIVWAVPVNMLPVTLYTWQPSYIVKPESTADRAEDWDNGGYEGAKWIQGFILEANTNGSTKQLGIRNGDTQVLQQVFPVNHPIQQEKAYSFVQPFVAHMVRWESSDGVDWSFFNIKWIFQKTPETVTTWWTQPSALGWRGYGHVYTINIAYASQANVLFTMTFDGISQVYTLPSTGGVYKKIFLNLQANKGKLYSFQYQSTAGFSDLQIWEEDFICEVGEWGRNDAYLHHVSVGGTRGDLAQI